MGSARIAVVSLCGVINALYAIIILVFSNVYMYMLSYKNAKRPTPPSVVRKSFVCNLQIYFYTRKS